ncbi:ricin-type beta-trefoil lectin domain protein [Lentzea sp. NPDC005914]|uniref:ricin-type beta-trefoil lectin domain protein n=1 Tax=Lentzea sp. NPDC005914 TaxID=3154572 RepID=UPI0033DBC6A3
MSSCCSGPAGQRWTSPGDGTLRVHDKCLDINGGDNLTPVIFVACNGDDTQQWTARHDGTIVNASANRCLDALFGDTANGTDLVIADCDREATCNGGQGQLARVGHNNLPAVSALMSTAQRRGGEVRPGCSCAEEAQDDEIGTASLQRKKHGSAPAPTAPWSVAGQRHAGQPAVLGRQPRDFAVDDADVKETRAFLVGQLDHVGEGHHVLGPLQRAWLGRIREQAKAGASQWPVRLAVHEQLHHADQLRRIVGRGRETGLHDPLRAVSAELHTVELPAAYVRIRCAQQTSIVTT